MQEQKSIDKELLDACVEALAMLKIYYVPNSDGTTPTIDKLEAVIKKATREVGTPDGL